MGMHCPRLPVYLCIQNINTRETGARNEALRSDVVTSMLLALQRAFSAHCYPSNLKPELDTIQFLLLSIYLAEGRTLLTK